MISQSKELSHKLSIEIKVVVGIILFTLLIVFVERYQLSKNVINQFFEAKKSKNLLLVNTIAPVLGLNISLGLDGSNRDYLDYIVKENPFVIRIQLEDSEGRIIYQNVNDTANNGHTRNVEDENTKEGIDFYDKVIIDSLSNAPVGYVHIDFSDKDFKALQSANRLLTLRLFAITFVLLIVFVILVRREFRHLKDLAQGVLSYDPKLNFCSLTASERHDEVGVIQNAVVSMVNKINAYNHILSEANLSLEEKIQERTQELLEANERLKSLSVTDELTQLSNRRYFSEYFEKTWELAKRKGVNVSLVLCDIDFFKMVNDTHGHQIGDEVLKSVATALKESLKRNTDFVARYGGEEFVIVMYDANFEEASLVCQRIQENLKKDQLVTPEGTKIEPVTMSFGISSLIPKNDENCESIIKNADDALYEAKRSGRNRIVRF